MGTRIRHFGVTDADDMCPNTAAALGVIYPGSFSTSILNEISAWVTGGVEVQGPPTENGSQVTVAEVARAAAAFQQHLAMVTEMRDWKRIPVEHHEHPQLTSEPDD